MLRWASLWEQRATSLFEHRAGGHVRAGCRGSSGLGWPQRGADTYALPVGTVVEDMNQRIGLVREYRGDAPKYVQRIRAAVDAAKALPYVDGTAWG
mmetsp:Transcript_21301/g.55594  ORF Transcript_21301/g.55594 Transcript_21301/m.55594 type:complete len:96 (-) Transcript_21301:260-547(-)